MKKFLFPLAACALLLSLVTPALASDTQQQEDQPTGKQHNFDQWQTIKRLQIRS